MFNHSNIILLILSDSIFEDEEEDILVLIEEDLSRRESLKGGSISDNKYNMSSININTSTTK